MKAKLPLPTLRWPAISLAVAAASALVSAQRGEGPRDWCPLPAAAIPAPAEDELARRAGEPAVETRARRLKAATIADLAGLHEEFRRLPPGVREEAMAWLFARWVELDAAGGWAFVRETHPDGDLQQAAYLVAWGRIDPAAAARTHDVDRGALLTHLALDELAETHPQAALDMLLALPAKLWVGSPARLVERLTKLDPEAAARATGKLMMSSAEWETFAQALGPLGADAASRALAAVPPSLRAEAWEAALACWPKDEVPALEAAMASRGGLPEGTRGMGPKRAPGEDLAAELGRVATTDSAVALAEALKAADRRQTTGSDASVADIPAFLPALSADASEVLKALAAQPAGPSRDRLVAALLRNAPVEDLLRWKPQLTDPVARERMDSSLIAAVANGRPDADLNEATLTAVGEGVGQAFASALAHQSQWEYFGPVAAKLEALPTERIESGLPALVEAVAKHDPAMALRFYERMPETARPETAAKLVGPWLEIDPQAASAWLVGQTGAVRERGTEALVRALASKEPDSAFAWGESLPEGGKRLQLLRPVVRDWAEDGAGIVERRIESSGLSAAEKQALREEVRR